MNTQLIPENYLIKFPCKGGRLLIEPAQIIRLESASNYTYIHLQNRRPIVVAKVLGAYENLLAPLGFVRTHRSHLINQSHVKTVNEKNQIIMDDESRIEVARRKSHVLKLIRLNVRQSNF